MAAAQNGRVDCVRVILEYGADASLRSKGGITALMFASHRNHASYVSLFLEQSRIDVDQADNAGRTVLMTAAQRNQTESLQILLA